MSEQVPHIIVDFNAELTDEQLAEFKRRFEEAMHDRTAHIVLPPRPQWALVKGSHDSGHIDAVYGPYTKEHAEWLLGNLLDGTYNNWTLAQLQEGP